MGCATTQVSQEQIREKFSDLAKLEQNIAEAEAADVNLLAPGSFSSAKTSLGMATTAARKDQVESANKHARQGLKALEQANADAERARELLKEVLVARQRAYDAGAKTLFDEELRILETDLADAGNLVERNKVEDAKRARPELKDSFLALELKAVKEGTVQLAKAAVKNAASAGADDFAPKMYAKAEEQLLLATNTLDADRTQRDKANTHARQAIIFADRSAEIAELVKDFERRKFRTEDIVIWHQNELSTATAPLDLGLQFTEPNETTVSTIRTAISKLIEDDKSNRQLAEARAVEIDRLNREHEAGMQSMRQRFEQEVVTREMAQEEITRMTKEQEEKFNRVQGMFDPKEANVFRMRDDVLLSVHGFSFPPGKSEISTDNFGLLNKIVHAITEFKSANVMISGHTDSTGSAEKNLSLSDQRAANVAKFLAEVGGIEPARISAEGFGEERPVASDTTPEGRASNRRVEVLIKTQ